MELEHYLNCVFGVRDHLDDANLYSLLEAEQVSEDEIVSLIEGWKARGWIHVLAYNQADGTLRYIYFIEYTTPRIV